MNVVSYAQNQEDIMLLRALRDVKRGFYIDVGAQQPVADSVTRLFYELGWTGINIDPMPQWVKMLQADRPHDINLQLAVSDTRGRMKFFAIPDTGLSTADPEFVKKHAEAGYQAQEIEVEVRTLDDVCADHDVHEVHFLKIDVEGAEENVIRGFSFDRVRPWVVVVEAVEPVAQREGDGSQEAIPTHASWEPILLAHGYDFVYWDGLNRFYLAREHQDLRSRFDTPPNPLDAFVRYNEWVKHERIVQLEGERRDLIDARDVTSKRRELGDVQGLLETAENRRHRIAVLEQDNARLIGRLSTLEEQQGAFHLAVQQSQQLLDEREEMRGQLDKIRNERDYLRGEHSPLMDERDKLRAELDQAKDEANWLRQDRDAYIAKIQVVLGSRSWQLTKPFRWLARLIRGQVPPSRPHVSQAQGRSLPRRAVRRVLFAGVRLVQRNENVRRTVTGILERVPFLQRRMLAFARHNAYFINPDLASGAVVNQPALTQSDFSPGARTIYNRMRSMAASSSVKHG